MTTKLKMLVLLCVLVSCSTQNVQEKDTEAAKNCKAGETEENCKDLGSRGLR